MSKASQTSSLSSSVCRHGSRFNNPSVDIDKLKCEHCGWFKHMNEYSCDLQGYFQKQHLCTFQQDSSGSGKRDYHYRASKPNANTVASTSSELGPTAPISSGSFDGGLSREEPKTF